MKIKLTLLIICLAAVVAKGQVLLDETFDYSATNLANESTWITLNDASHYITTGVGRTIVSPALTYSNAGGTYFLSGKGKTINSDYSAGSDYYSYKTITTTPYSAGTIYMSLMFKAGVAQSQSWSEVMSIASGSTSGPKILVGKGVVSTSSYRFLVSRGSSSSTDYKVSTPEFADVNQVIFLVVKYDFTTQTASLFINPTIGSTIEPTADAFDNTSATIRTTLDGIRFRSTGTSTAKFNVGGVRVSTTWADAVKSQTNAPKLPAPVVGVASVITTSGFTANWAKVTGAIGYDVKVYQGTNLISTTTVNGQAVESAAITGLVTGTDYTYTVIAKGDAISFINSDPSSASAIFTTLGLPAPIVGAASDITVSGFTANWTPVTNANGYEVKVYLQAVLVSTTAVSGQASASVAIPGLTMGTTYTYTVVAKGNGTTILDSSPSAASIAFPTLSASVNSVNTNFGTGIWGTVYAPPSTNPLIPAIKPSWFSNGFEIIKGYLYGSLPYGPKGELHTNIIRLDNGPNGGMIALPTINSLEQIEIHAFTGSDSRSFTITEYNGTSWDLVNTYGTMATESIYVINISRTAPTKLRIENNTGSTLSIAQIITRTTKPQVLDIPVVGSATAINGAGFTANWTSVSNATGYSVIVSNSTTIVKSVTATGQASQSLAITGLEITENCTFKVSATGDGGVSFSDSYLSAASPSFVIARLATPVVGLASEITSTGFTANWIAVPNAENYDIMVYQDVNLVSTFNAIGQSTTSVLVTGLESNKIYTYKVIAKGNNTSTFDSKESLASASITTYSLSQPTLASPTVVSVTTTSAILGATVSTSGVAPISERGTVWGTSPNPTGNLLAEGGIALSAFSHIRQGMIPNTLYYYRAYATNSLDTGYSSGGTFTTLPVSPTIASATTISVTSFTANWKAPVNQGSAVFTYTLLVSSDNSFASNVITFSDINSSVLSKVVTGLIPSTKYYFKVMAVNAGGNSEFSSVANLTLSNPLSMPTATLITTTGATLNGSVVMSSNATLLACGTVLGASVNPTDNPSPITGTLTEAISQVRTGLIPNTLYHYRTYATYATGTTYSSDAIFTTLSLLLLMLAYLVLRQIGQHLLHKVML